MITRLEWFITEIRRRMSRSEWFIHLKKLSKSSGTGAQTGLVLVQIDGLSRPQLERALAGRKMPFLNSLLTREGYELHSLFSGLPSNTPGFQGNLLYGIKHSVPAFSFRDRKTGGTMIMYDPRTVAGVQAGLEKRGRGLLEGGSSYSNVYTGGAAESNFCPATLPLLGHEKAGGIFTKFLFFLGHSASLLPIFALMILESGLAVLDLLRGLIAGMDFWKELKFVPTRVAISILLRDLVTIGARIDIARGLPVIHLNYLGYDEQAHRRGPSSAFAHWTLKGIDRSIKKIVTAARRSSRRDYSVWVFSDHGQEETLPFEKETGQTIEEAVGSVFSRLHKSPSEKPETSLGVQLQRAGWLGGWFARGLIQGKDSRFKGPKPLVTSMGPLGHIYPAGTLALKERNRIARDLVQKAGIPLVWVPEGDEGARAWTTQGEFLLPLDAKKILGEGHPFLEETARQMVSLANHPDAGTFIISGWRTHGRPISFPIENGAHAGPGPRETWAFLMVPPGTGLNPHPEGFLRAGDLREAVREALHHPRTSIKKLFRDRPREKRGVRIMTYNVHSCIGMDRKLFPDRIARVIAEYDPDIVALQELDVGRRRTKKHDQAFILAERLEMDHHFHPALHVEEEKYGDAILTRLPVRLIRAGKLPGLPDRPWREPRGALWVAIDLNGRELQLINTHLGLSRRERQIQTRALLGPGWLGHPDCREPVILCGDFNTLPGSPAFRLLTGSLRDAQIAASNHRPRGTWFGRLPFNRIDHILVDRSIQVTGVKVPRTALTRVASDHLPLIADLKL